MFKILIPPSKRSLQSSELRTDLNVTVIGANGAGKSRFIEQCSFGDNQSVLRLSALYANGVTPPHKVAGLNGIFNALLTNDRILKRAREAWHKIFGDADNDILKIDGRIVFSTAAGSDLIEAERLSQGERSILFLIGATLLAPRRSILIVDNPSLFIHPSILYLLWNVIEDLRKDCLFIYNTVDAEFVASRTRNLIIWIKDYNSAGTWDYEIVSPDGLTEEMLLQLTGARRPVMFIEGDTGHSIDFRLYSAVFPEWRIRPLGSCSKVIESVRSFNDLPVMHHLKIKGIIDRDRRTVEEVDYLRRKNILVPEVAEIENIFLSENVVREMALYRRRNPDRILNRLKKTVFKIFRAQMVAQSLQHTRYMIKRRVEYKIDAKFSCITALETHLRQLINELQPREEYNRYNREFATMLTQQDYAAVLRVFNYKSMLTASNVFGMLGYQTNADYIDDVIGIMRGNSRTAENLRMAVRDILKADEAPPPPPPAKLEKKSLHTPAVPEHGNKYGRKAKHKDTDTQNKKRDRHRRKKQNNYEEKISHSTR